jgi:CspA family cold shock protein
MQCGTVKVFFPNRGYGFILAPDGREVMVHQSVIQMEGYRTLDEGEVVHYDCVETEHGLRATRVLRTEETPIHARFRPSVRR